MRTLFPVKNTLSNIQRRHLCKQVTAAVLLALLAGCAPSHKEIDPWTRDKDAVLSAIKSDQSQNTALGQQIQELTRQIIKLQKTDKKQISQLSAMEASLQAMREQQGKLILSHKKHLKKEKADAVHAAKYEKIDDSVEKGPTLEEKIAEIEHDLNQTIEQATTKSSVIVNQPSIEKATLPKKAIPPTKPVDPATEKNSYSAAYLSLKSGRFEEASTKFLTHLKNFPRGKLTDQALYWLGESYLAQQRSKVALKALQQLVRDYPRSGKYGAALLRIASLYEKKNRKGDAKAAYLQLIQTQPNSNAAERARTRLAALK